ncbi:hypothetical protein T440DRAFT_98097 [Plenodomus tracheiphilus IPT5]|uniref:Uncharacterized protein n=1 Tax=Plenodomus tracheiphilus IPT5 TaxID=1408161 RepID=A0A6A7BNW7_9PLEO|nr:hypothetical protein T440DRAFT_98097 [Plenodomus tracheiphilus IPT5]
MIGQALYDTFCSRISNIDELTTLARRFATMTTQRYEGTTSVRGIQPMHNPCLFGRQHHSNIVSLFHLEVLYPALFSYHTDTLGPWGLDCIAWVCGIGQNTVLGDCSHQWWRLFVSSLLTRLVYYFPNFSPLLFVHSPPTFSIEWWLVRFEILGRHLVCTRFPPGFFPIVLCLVCYTSYAFFRYRHGGVYSQDWESFA